MGQRTLILVPAAAPRAKLVQMASYGAQVLPVDGTYDDAFELSLQATRMFGWYNRNTAFNPFTVEGKKTASFEIVLEFGGQAPDAVLVPTGDGVIVSGVAKGFRDLVAAGVLPKVPRLLAVQASGSASIARALERGEPLRAEPDAHTVADSICVAAPRAGLLAVREVTASGGAGVIVDDEAIVAAIGELARLGAVFAEPAGATGLAGLHVALERGLVSPDERVVLLVTGHGLKDIAAAARGIEIAEAIPPRPEALRERLEGLSR
jgi:threonine synthase